MTSKGILQHHFWGEYHAGIVLEFPSTDHALGALETLPGFAISTKHPECLTWFGDSESLAKLKAQFRKWGVIIEPCGRNDCRGQCQSEDIDGVPHSIDFGPPFVVNIPADPKSQMRLFEMNAV